MQDAFSAVDLADGTELEGYTIDAPLSAGAMGAVYRARRTEDGTPVAIKRLLDTRHVARFEIEARLLSSLHHPRVVDVMAQQADGVARAVVEGPEGITALESCLQHCAVTVWAEGLVDQGFRPVIKRS